jgi:hypothetical protein
MIKAEDFIEKYEKIVKTKERISEIRCRRKSECSFLIIDNFYENPDEIIENALSLDFHIVGNGDTFDKNSITTKNLKFPGKRTQSMATYELKHKIEQYIMSFGGKMVNFYIPSQNDRVNGLLNNNGAFQITNSYNKSYIHTDCINQYNWGGIVFLSKHPPLESGTLFYQYNNGVMTEHEKKLTYKTEFDSDRYDDTKWELINKIGNVFNRLILFRSKCFHISADYFGNGNDDFRLTQVFFFKTEF